MPKEEKETDEQRLERTIGERVADALKQEKMDPDEKRVRSIVREEMHGVLSSFFSEGVDGDDGDDGDDDDEPKSKPKGKGKNKGLLGDLLGG